jgi:hypothetical protein
MYRKVKQLEINWRAELKLLFMRSYYSSRKIYNHRYRELKLCRRLSFAISRKNPQYELSGTQNPKLGLNAAGQRNVFSCME